MKANIRMISSNFLMSIILLPSVSFVGQVSAGEGSALALTRVLLGAALQEDAGCSPGRLDYRGFAFFARNHSMSLT